MNVCCSRHQGSPFTPISMPRKMPSVMMCSPEIRPSQPPIGRAQHRLAGCFALVMASSTAQLGLLALDDTEIAPFGMKGRNSRVSRPFRGGQRAFRGRKLRPSAQMRNSAARWRAGGLYDQDRSWSASDRMIMIPARDAGRRKEKRSLPLRA